ncbi:hypothetical protein Pcinc_032385, partial [Petrolisthes cinctipes]
RILEVHSADEFYTVMGVLTREMLTFGLMDANKLVQKVVGMAPFPFPGLADLRDKYTYNITPWTQSVSSVAKRGLRLFYSDDDDDDNDEDDQTIAVATAFGLSGIFRKNMEISRGPSPVGGGSAVSPSGFPPLSFASPRHSHDGGGGGGGGRDSSSTRPNLDISALKKQYARLRERQKQAHIILTASQQRMSSTLVNVSGGGGHRSSPLTMNHLLRGKKALTSKTKRVVPQGVIPTMKPRKKADRKLSEPTGRPTRPSPQPQQQKKVVGPGVSKSTGGSVHPHKPLQRTSTSTLGPPKVETLYWKDTPRRDRRASLPSGVKLLEGTTSLPQSTPLGVPAELDDEEDGSSTSTELCDDDDDKLSDLESDVNTEPRPATTSPRLETVQEAGKTSPLPPTPPVPPPPPPPPPPSVLESVAMPESSLETKTVTAAAVAVVADVPAVTPSPVVTDVPAVTPSPVVTDVPSVTPSPVPPKSVEVIDSVVQSAIVPESESVVLSVLVPKTEMQQESTEEVQVAPKEVTTETKTEATAEEAQVAPPTESAPTPVPETITEDKETSLSNKPQPEPEPLTSPPVVSNGTDEIKEMNSEEAVSLKVETPIYVTSLDQKTVVKEKPQSMLLPPAEEETDVSVESIVRDLKSIGAGSPLEDLLTKKNLTAAEIIARIPFPSDVSFMQEEENVERSGGAQGTSSPFSSLHYVTPEMSPVGSPVLRVSSPELRRDSLKPSPNTSPSKSLSLSSSPSPRDSPVSKTSKLINKSPSASPVKIQTQDQVDSKMTLIGLPPVPSPDLMQEIYLTQPKSPKITVEDEKRNIFEIHSGRPGLNMSQEDQHEEVIEDAVDAEIIQNRLLLSGVPETTVNESICKSDDAQAISRDEIPNEIEVKLSYKFQEVKEQEVIYVKEDKILVEDNHYDPTAIFKSSCSKSGRVKYSTVSEPAEENGNLKSKTGIAEGDDDDDVFVADNYEDESERLKGASEHLCLTVDLKKDEKCHEPERGSERENQNDAVSEELAEDSLRPSVSPGLILPSVVSLASPSASKEPQPPPSLTSIAAPLPLSASIEPQLPLSASIEPPLPLSASIEPQLPLSASTEPQLPLSASTEPPLPLSVSVEPQLPLSASTEPPLPLSVSVEPQLPLSASIELLPPLSASIEPPLSASMESLSPLLASLESPLATSTTEPLSTISWLSSLSLGIVVVDDDDDGVPSPSLFTSSSLVTPLTSSTLITPLTSSTLVTPLTSSTFTTPLTSSTLVTPLTSSTFTTPLTSSTLVTPLTSSTLVSPLTSSTLVTPFMSSSVETLYTCSSSLETPSTSSTVHTTSSFISSSLITPPFTSSCLITPYTVSSLITSSSEVIHSGTPSEPVTSPDTAATSLTSTQTTSVFSHTFKKPICTEIDTLLPSSSKIMDTQITPLIPSPVKTVDTQITPLITSPVKTVDTQITPLITSPVKTVDTQITPLITSPVKTVDTQITPLITSPVKTVDTQITPLITSPVKTIDTRITPLISSPVKTVDTQITPLLPSSTRTVDTENISLFPSLVKTVDTEINYESEKVVDDVHPLTIKGVESDIEYNDNVRNEDHSLSITSLDTEMQNEDRTVSGVQLSTTTTISSTSALKQDSSEYSFSIMPGKLFTFSKEFSNMNNSTSLFDDKEVHSDSSVSVDSFSVSHLTSEILVAPKSESLLPVQKREGGYTQRYSKQETEDVSIHTTLTPEESVSKTIFSVAGVPCVTTPITSTSVTSDLLKEVEKEEDIECITGKVATDEVTSSVPHQDSDYSKQLSCTEVGKRNESPPPSDAAAEDIIPVAKDVSSFEYSTFSFQRVNPAVSLPDRLTDSSSQPSFSEAGQRKESPSSSEEAFMTAKEEFSFDFSKTFSFQTVTPSVPLSDSEFSSKPIFTEVCPKKESPSDAGPSLECSESFSIQKLTTVPLPDAKSSLQSSVNEDSEKKESSMSDPAATYPGSPTNDIPPLAFDQIYSFHCVTPSAPLPDTDSHLSEQDQKNETMHSDEVAKNIISATVEGPSLDSRDTASCQREVRKEPLKSKLSLEERISAILGLDVNIPTWRPQNEDIVPVTTSASDSLISLLSSIECTRTSPEHKEDDTLVLPKSPPDKKIFSPVIEERSPSPLPILDRESSLSASLEGRLSFFASEVTEGATQEEEVKCSGGVSADKDDTHSDDNEAETETDFFNGKDLSSEAIRQRLWRGVKSLSLDADVCLDPDVFCFLIEQSSKHCRKSKAGERKSMPKRRNSEIALQELVKENTEIIERILRQKSLENSTQRTGKHSANTPCDESPLEAGLRGSEMFFKSLAERRENSYSNDPLDKPSVRMISSEKSAVAASESHEGATTVPVTAASRTMKLTSPKNGSQQQQQKSPPEKKQSYKGEESASILSPTRPITFNPFPTRNITRQPKEVAVKLGLYSPTKKTSTSPT